MVTVNRVSGPTRYETAAAIAEKKYPSGDPNGNVVLATGVNFPDALAGNYLAGQLHAPIMLTPTHTSDPEFATTQGALAKLLPGSAKNVVILGGTDAVGADVASALTGAGYNVTRIGGLTRYDTAQMVDTQQGDTAGAGVSGQPTAMVATGENFPDALASGPLSWDKHFPIVLTNGTQSTLSPQAQATLTADHIKNVLIMGGSAAISPGINSALTGMGITIDKQFSGADRTDTAAQLATYEITNYGFSNSSVILASGGNFPDALAAGPWGGDPQPIVLTEPDLTLGQYTTSFLQNEAGTLSTINVAGGSAAVPDATVNAAVAAAETTPKGATAVLPELVSASILQTVTQGAASANNPSGTTIQYVFSQKVTGAAFNAAGFHAYDFTDGRYTAFAVVADPSNANAVDAFYPSTGTGTTTAPGSDLGTTAGAANLTLATVGGPNDPGGAAVVLNNGATSPDGSAAIGTASTTASSAAGVTAAPNPESWSITNTGGANPAQFPNSTPINVTFDKAAFVQNTAGFRIVLVTTPTTTVGSNEVTCTAPATNSSATTLPSGGTIPGGNGTTTITIVCPNIGGSATPITAAQIARVVVLQGAVGTAAVGGAGNIVNPLEVADSPHTTSDSPDLTGFAIIPGAAGSATPDQLVYSFDEPIILGAVTGFGYYLSNGNQINCSANAAPTAGTNTTPGTQPCSEQINPQNSTQVLVNVGTGTGPTGPGATANATGGIVRAGTVANQNVTVVNGTPNVHTLNADDEQGGANPNNAATTVTPGTVNAPQLKTVHVASTTNAAGTTTTATYTFSQALGGVSANSLHLYDSDGTEMTCTAATVGTVAAGTANQVTCTAFGLATALGTAPTNTQLTGSVLGTADFAAVVGSGVSPASANLNPEGGIHTT